MAYIVPTHRPGGKTRNPTTVPLPAEYADMVRRIDSHSFQIIGLPIDLDAPEFPDRQKAEQWLLDRLPKVVKKLGRKFRPCLRCNLTFLSHGLGNRLCDPCRGSNE